MKIAIDARESGTTSGRYVDKLLEYLQKIDHENEYAFLLKKHRLDIYRDMPANFHAVECNIKEFTIAEQTKLARLLYRLKPDLVHFPMVQQPLMYFGRTVTTMQDLTTLRFRNPSKNPLVFWFKQRVYWIVNFVAPRKSKHVIAISEFTKQDVMKTMRYNHPNKFTVTLESADAMQGPSVPVDLLKGTEFIMYVGRHQPHKNLARLIDAHQILLRDHPNLQLVIVGKIDATTEVLVKKIAQSKYQNIMFTGFVSDQQLRWLYEHTSCYVFPSLSEGFGLPGLEAQIHGAPVASSNATCLPEIYGDSAHYFDPLDINDMATKISDVIKNKNLRNELIAKGKKQVAKYSWQRMAEQTLVVYKNSFIS
jgi:glycosyltransferase involved in cell wall biosynthesis